MDYQQYSKIMATIKDVYKTTTRVKLMNGKKVTLGIHERGKTLNNKHNYLQRIRKNLIELKDKVVILKINYSDIIYGVTPFVQKCFKCGVLAKVSGQDKKTVNKLRVIVREGELYDVCTTCLKGLNDRRLNI